MPEPPDHPPNTCARIFAHHPRKFGSMRYVYPVISRRSGGLSIGVNLNPDKLCNFDCVYCQVRRHDAPASHALREDARSGLPRLHDELLTLIQSVRDGSFWQLADWRDTPEHLRVWRDVAFSGDGEPTLCPWFAEAVDKVLDMVRQWQGDAVKLILLSNATTLHHPRVREPIDRLLDGGGQLWAKLDAGTQEYYEQIDRSSVPLNRVVSNITEVARSHAVVIQTMLLRWHGQTMSDAEFGAYVERLRQIIDAGGRIEAVQLYTVARRPSEPDVQPIDLAALQSRAAELYEALPNTSISVHG